MPETIDRFHGGPTMQMVCESEEENSNNYCSKSIAFHRIQTQKGKKRRVIIVEDKDDRSSKINSEIHATPKHGSILEL